MRSLPTLLRDSKAATMIEYGLIAALVAIAAISAIQTPTDDTAPQTKAGQAKPGRHPGVQNPPAPASLTP